MALFDWAFAVIDGAVSGAILAGVHPYAFEPVLSFWFLRCAGTTRNKPEKVIESWLKDLDAAFDPILTRIAGFARSYRGDLSDCGEEKELEKLISASQSSRGIPSDLELRRQNRQAVAVIEWGLEVLSRKEKLPAYLVELALIVEYLKVAAMSEDVDESIYLVVKQSIPAVGQAYEDVLA